MSGGVAFFADQDTKIVPSCCCGLEAWTEVYHAVREKSSPWLGHDPSPGIAYQGDVAMVCSDDPEFNHDNQTRGVPFYIEYRYEDLLQCLDQTKEDLVHFIEGPLYQWVSRRNAEIGNRLKQHMERWFLSGLNK